MTTIKQIDKLEKEKIKSYCKAISNTSHKEKDLLFRRPQEVEKILKKNNSYLFFDSNELVGFLLVNNIYKNWYELETIYLDKNYRGKKIIDTVFNKFDKISNYFLYTKNPHLIEISLKNNFVFYKNSKLPVLISLLILFDRIKDFRRANNMLKELPNEKYVKLLVRRV